MSRKLTMITQYMQYRNLWQLKEHSEYYKERMPEAGVRKFLGHIIRRIKHGTWKNSPEWIIENHPGMAHHVFTDKNLPAGHLWQEHKALVRAVNEIEREKQKHTGRDLFFR